MSKKINKELEENAIIYLTKALDESVKVKSEKKARSLIEEYGPVIDFYPIWHPFVSNNEHPEHQVFHGENLGYIDLDHCVTLKNAIINCPYDHINPLNLINHIKKMEINKNKEIIIGKELEFKLYDMFAIPILISYKDLNKSILSQKKILELWEKSLYPNEYSIGGEGAIYRFHEWEDVVDLFLGKPNNGKESTFVTSQTVDKMKIIWKTKKSKK